MRVVKFHKVMTVGGAGVAATSVQLTDGDVIRNYRQDLHHNTRAACTTLQVGNCDGQGDQARCVIRRHRGIESETVRAAAKRLAG